MRDLVSKFIQLFSIASAAVTASVNGVGVDLQGYGSAAIVFNPGVITDGTHSPSVEESDDNSAFTAVSANDLQGTLIDLASNVNQKIGYKGNKRYIRAVSTVATATVGGIYGAQVVLGNSENKPL